MTLIKTFFNKSFDSEEWVFWPSLVDEFIHFSISCSYLETNGKLINCVSSYLEKILIQFFESLMNALSLPC